MKNENQITATVKLMNDVSLTEKFSSDNAAMTWVTSQNSTGILAEWMIDTGWKSVTNMSQAEIKII